MKYYLIIKDAINWLIENSNAVICGYKNICDYLLNVLDFNRHTEADKIYLKITEMNINKTETLIKQHQFNNIAEAENKIKSWIIYQ